MNVKGSANFLVFATAQSLTACRIFLAAGALFAAANNRLDYSAGLVSLGIVTDGLDGAVARKLKVESDFGALFDYFADYLCYIVAPWMLSLVLLEAQSPLSLAVLTLPLLTGAVRYSRNGNLVRSESFERTGFPGLLTVFYALLLVAVVFLGVPATGFSRWLIVFFILIFSALMVSPIRYPKLTKFKPVFGVVFLSLAVMPFFLTQFLAICTLALTLAYAFAAPFLMPQGRGKPAIVDQGPELR